MKFTIKDYILVSIIALLLVICLFKQCGSSKQIIQNNDDKHKLDSLQSLSNLKSDSIEDLQLQVVGLNAEKQDLEFEILKNKNKKTIIKNETRKKDSVISFYNVNELEHFFTNRYDSSSR